jgi:hypothetical protein
MESMFVRRPIAKSRSAKGWFVRVRLIFIPCRWKKQISANIGPHAPN